VIPGLAQVQVRNLSSDLDGIAVVTMPMDNETGSLAPKPEVLEASKTDVQLFSGSLWIMLRGSWKVQLEAVGRSGRGELSVPLPAVSTGSAKMAAGLKVLLAGAGLLLVLGLLRIVGAANGEAELEAGEKPSSAASRRARVGMGIASILIVGSLWFGNWWWNQEASASVEASYRVPRLEAQLHAGNVLHLRLENPNAPRSRKFFLLGGKIQADHLVPDHGHLLHLFLVRMPELDSFWHLHPIESENGEFAVKLPSLPAGEYQIYADVVHQSGFPETEVGTITLPAVVGQALQDDDSGAVDLRVQGAVCQLADGHRLVWMRSSDSFRVNQPHTFRFRLEDRDGAPARNVESYMGMAGHAVFLRDDGKVFVHIHPEGSISMAALTMAQASSQTLPRDVMAGMSHAAASAEAAFPYGFPAPGEYHIFVQMKRAGRVATCAFRAHVDR
jgi:hypothetical protein